MASTKRGERASAVERLRRIESVTDAALAILDVEDLLDELLVRVRDALEVDTAAVLLIDEASESLVATAASGLEEEVRQRIRVPMGAGFAGRIAAEVKPRVIEDVSTADVFNPILREKGIQSLAGAPLVIEGRVIGVIHVGSLTTRRFGPEDIDLLEKVAGLVALSVEARRSNVERTAAAAVCSAASSRRGCRLSPASSSPRGTCPPTRVASGATGTTCSTFPTAMSGS